MCCRINPVLPWGGGGGVGTIFKIANALNQSKGTIDIIVIQTKYIRHFCSFNPLLISTLVALTVITYSISPEYNLICYPKITIRTRVIVYYRLLYAMTYLEQWFVIKKNNGSVMTSHKTLTHGVKGWGVCNKPVTKVLLFWLFGR